MVQRIKNGIVYTNGVATDIATQIGGNTAPLNMLRTTVDSAGNAIAFINSNGLVGTYTTATAVSKTITVADLETIIDCTAAVTITIPTDATLGLGATVTNFISVGILQRGATTPVIAVAVGITLRGTAPTISQWGTFGLMRVGVNEWSYV